MNERKRLTWKFYAKLWSGHVPFYFYFLGFIFLGMLLIINPASSTGFKVSSAAFYAFLLAVPVYLHFFALKRLFNKKKYGAYALSVVVIIAGCGTLNHFLLHTLFNDLNLLWIFYVHTLVLMTITTALKFINTDIQEKRRIQKSETQRLEKVLVNLKSTIAPESILKQLIELHKLSLENPEKLPDMILNYSENMREMLKKPVFISNERQEKVGERKKEIFAAKLRRFKPLNSRFAWMVYTWLFGAFLLFMPLNTTDLQYSQKFVIYCYFVALTLPAYLNFLLVDRFLKNKLLVYIPLVTFMIVSVAFLYSTIFSAVFAYSPGLIVWIEHLIFAVIITTAIRVVKNGLKNRIQAQEIKVWHLQSELNLLKSQVNPHFLFNTLNNLYSLSLDQSEKLPEVTRKLHDLMKYMLESSNNHSVDLEWESNFLENYLSLEKLRFNENANIVMSLQGNPKGKKIAPMLLIPFVENSFKHGIPSDSNLFFVHINLKIERKTLYFSVKNSIAQRLNLQVSATSGLGLKNVKRRLELLYPNRHNLLIEEKNNNFSVTLEIRL